MPRRFASDFLRDRLAARDLLTLHKVVTSAEAYDRSRPCDGLPPPLFLFVRVFEWIGSTRSGVWQYYEGLEPRKADEILDVMTDAKWAEVCKPFAFGRDHWREGLEVLDDWLDVNEAELRAMLVALLTRTFETLDALG